jgi:hypothetical protein
MQPLTVIIGIILGSTVAIALGLIMVLVIFLVMGSERAALGDELVPLLRSAGLFTVLAALAFASFIGSLKRTRWRHLAMAAMWSGLILTTWIYWPRT